jgi:YHS domain-containing protein
MLKQLIMVLSLVTFFGILVLAQDKSETTNKEKQNCTKDSSSCCSKQKMHSDMKMESSTETASTTVWNKVCPVKGEEVDADAPTFEYKGKVIGFCCPGCDKKFQKDPEKYMKNLNEDGTKFIGKS